MDAEAFTARLERFVDEFVIPERKIPRRVQEGRRVGKPSSSPGPRREPLCIDSELDFMCDERGRPITVRSKETFEVHKALCAACGVRGQCLEAGLRQTPGWGIWGGTTPKERMDIKKRRTRVTERTNT